MNQSLLPAKFLNIGTESSEQTVQGLYCFPFHLHFFNALLHQKPDCSVYMTDKQQLVLVSQLLEYLQLPYFFGYKTVFFSFQNNPKVLDPSCKMDLELWHCLGRVELVL